MSWTRGSWMPLCFRAVVGLSPGESDFHGRHVLAESEFDVCSDSVGIAIRCAYDDGSSRSSAMMYRSEVLVSGREFEVCYTWIDHKCSRISYGVTERVVDK